MKRNKTRFELMNEKVFWFSFILFNVSFYWLDYLTGDTLIPILMADGCLLALFYVK